MAAPISETDAAVLRLTDLMLLGLFPVMEAPKASQDLIAHLTPDVISCNSSGS